LLANSASTTSDGLQTPAEGHPRAGAWSRLVRLLLLPGLGGGDESLVAIYQPTSAGLHDVIGQERGLTSAIRVHVFMERPRREKARAVLEVIGAP